MPESVTLLDTDMSSWTPGTRHYATSGGQYLAVSVDPGITEPVTEIIEMALQQLDAPTIASGMHRFVVQPTVILPCSDTGRPVDLTPLHIAPPGTSYEDALQQAGYTV